MTPPNKLEELAEFQDAIQSNEGLERLRAMQYLQQMNNQGLMGMPQVQQQPVVQRQQPGNIASGLSGTLPGNAEALTEAAQSGLRSNITPSYFQRNQSLAKNFDPFDPANDMSGENQMEIGELKEQELIANELAQQKELDSDPFTLENQYKAADILINGGTDEERIYAREIRAANPEGVKAAMDALYSDSSRAGGGPVINKGFGGSFADAIAQATAAGAFKQPAGTEPALRPVSLVTQNVGQAVPFMGGSGVAIPDPNISQEQGIANLRQMQSPFGGDTGISNFLADSFENIQSDRGAQGLKQAVNYVEAPAEENIIEQTMESANADAMERGMPSFIFNSQEFETGTMTPIRANTQAGLRERAVEGGLINRDNRFSGALMAPNPNFVTPEEGLNQIAMGQPNVQRFMDNNTSDGSLGPVNPRMVEYTPPFYGGGMTPSPRMVPADRDGNPMVSGPFTNSKQPSGPYAIGQEPGSPFMANQGGYVQNLAGGGIVQGRELQQLKEGGLVDLPVVNMGIGGFLRSVFRAPARIVKGIAKGAKKVLKSKTFRALAPLVLAVAAPYALGALAPGVFGAGATFMGGALSTTGALGYGLTTGLGSLVGNMLGGAKFGDAAKQGLMSGLTAGAFKGFGTGNWMGTGTGSNVASQVGNVKQINAPKTILQAGTESNAVVAPATGGNPFANQMAARPVPIGENILTNVNAVPPNVGTPDAYTGQGLQANQMMATPSAAVETVVPNQFSNIEYAPNVDRGISAAPDATRESLFNSRLSNAGGSPAPGTGSTLDSIKQIGKDIYKDYSNLGGVAKLVGMDAMQPDWDAVYASEEAMENQLADMGYTVDTGFDGQRVYRDSSGTVMPSNLTARDLLDRALGRTPRTRLADRIGFEPNATALAAKGGLVSLAGGGEFSGKVEGEGHGMEDNVYMPIVERGQGSQVGTLAVSPAEYVVDAHTMSALGNGNADEGARVMDNVIASVRKKAFGTREQPKQIDGLNALMPMMQGV